METIFTVNYLISKILRPLLLLCMLLLMDLISYGQSGKGTISGLVTDSTGKGIGDVSVEVKGLKKGTLTDQKGEFILTEIPEGSRQILFQHISFNAQEINVEVKANEATVIPTVTLKHSVLEVDPVPIMVNPNKYDQKQSDYVAKLPLKNIENPQVYNTISSRLMEDQVVTNFNDAMKNAPGLDRLWESTGRGSDGAGYFSLRGFSVQPTMVNGLPGLTNGGLDPANIERIEVMKGPSGTLYGSSLISYGGLINIVTKKPYDHFGGNITYTSGSFGLNRIAGDINAPLNKEKTIALRLNSAYHSENSFQDAGFRKSLLVAPSLSYRASNRLSFLVNTEFFNSEGTNQTMLFLNRSLPLVSKNLDELNYNPERSFTSNDITIKNPNFNLQAQMNYKLSDQWISQTVFSRSTAKTDGYYTYLWDIADGNKTFIRYISKQNSITEATDIQQNFIGDFKIGKFRNRLVAGVDYFQRNIINNSTGYVAFDQIRIQDADPSKMSRPAVDTALAKTSVSKSTTGQSFIGFYVSDVFNITSKLSVMMSLRVDHFENQGNYNAQTNVRSGYYGQTALSPKLGIVYQILQDKLSVFGNYLNGFTNVAPRPLIDNSFKTFSPEQANQWEFGVKTDLYEGKVSASISYYDITVSNVVRDLGLMQYEQDGKNFSKGLETSIIASPVNGLNLILGYSYNNSKVQSTSNIEFLGRRPESAGPENMVNGWISYRLSKGSLKGFGLGFGGNYFSENVILNRASTGEFKLPAYTILNTSIFYDAYAYRITLKVDNLTNQEYYKGWSTVNPQRPRTILASMSYKF